MTQKYQNRFVLPLLVLVIFFVADRTVQACVCSGGDNSTLGKFESAQNVVVNKIVSLHKEPRVRVVSSGGEVRREPIMTIVSIKMIVEKVYKGNLKAGDEMIFGQGENYCSEKFEEKEVGARFLFYLDARDEKQKLWYANSCWRSEPLPDSPTNDIQDAAHDLLYLEKMNEVSGRTRISGTLISYQWSIADGGADFKKLAGQKIQVVGNGQTYEALTNEDSVYEIYDLPVGTYDIRPEVRQGWAIDERSPFGGRSSGTNEDDGSSQVVLKPGRHAYADFILKVNNRLSGRVLNASGRPMRSVCLGLLPTQPNVSQHFKRGGCTDAGGRFEFEEIPFASYVVVINPDDKISSRQPFRKFYYPNTADREKARVITIAEGETKYPLDIRITETKEIVTISGKVLSANGKPVVSAGVSFTSDQTDETIDGSAFAWTDELGNFSLNVFKGLTGRLTGAVRLDPTEFKECPGILLVGGGTSLDRRTEAVRVQSESDVAGVELKLPFPTCRGNKIRSQIKVD